MDFNIRTVFLHCKLLKDRKKSILKQTEFFNFKNYSIYEDYDVVDLNDNIINEYYDKSQTIKKLQEGYGIQISSFNELHKKQISLNMKFGKCFELLSTYNDEYFLVLEDDVIFCENFVEKFYDHLKRCPKDWDVIYLGNGINLIPDNITADNNFYIRNHPASKCSDSMILTKKALDDLNKTWFPFSLGSDFELSYQHVLHNHKVYWWHPPLIYQGSQNGTFESCFGNNL